MKLVFCTECNHIFSLSFSLRSCECGRVKGRYIDETHAEVNGKGFSLAIGNGSLFSAIGRMGCLHELTREGYEQACQVSCWVRPHEGEANPQTSVNARLGEEDQGIVDARRCH